MKDIDNDIGKTISQLAELDVFRKTASPAWLRPPENSLLKALQDFERNSAAATLGKALSDMSSTGVIAQLRAFEDRLLDTQFTIPKTTDFFLPSERQVHLTLANLGATLSANYKIPILDLENSLSRVSSPWLDLSNDFVSFTSFSRLHGIGHLVSSQQPFSEEVSKTLRLDLGDWRDPMDLPSDVSSDVLVRTSLYLEQGFDQELTAFPDEAYDEAIEVSGLSEGLSALFAVFGNPFPEQAADQAEVSHRSRDAYYLINGFELWMRNFIDTVMTQAFGSKWLQHRTPNGFYGTLLTRQGEDSSCRPLLSYLDFSDYERIICRADNWKTVFQHFFGRTEFVRESLQRLRAPRNATMHASPVTREDILLIYAEIHRFVRAGSSLR